MEIDIDYIEIYPNWVRINNETFNSAEGAIETTVIYRGMLFVFHKTESESKQNVFAIDLKQERLIWKIQKHPISEIDHLNPYVGILRKLCTKDYIVLSKADSRKVAVNPQTGKILNDIDLNKGQRPW